MLTLKKVGTFICEMADSTDKHLASGVESFVSYMDKHPGFSAVLSPTSVLRRITYRQTEETITRSRGVGPVDSTF
jgi:hypothetical protein